MLSIEEIKLALKVLKKFKPKELAKFVEKYTNELEELAYKVDAYNNDQIQQLDKTTSWFEADLNWRANHKDVTIDPLLDFLIKQKINHFSKMGASAGSYNSLEIGPGDGRFSKCFVAWRLNFFIDVLKRCENKIKKKFHPPHFKYLRFYTTDRTECKPIPNNSCNFVFSWDTFTFFTQKHIDEYLRDINRIMIPGAYGLIHYCNADYEKDLREAKRGYWNYNTKQDMKKLVEKNGYDVIEMDQFMSGANYVIFQKPGNGNPVVYKVVEIPVEK